MYTTIGWSRQGEGQAGQAQEWPHGEHHVQPQHGREEAFGEGEGYHRVCMYACMYVCMYINPSWHICMLFMFVICRYLCRYVCMYVYICMYVCMYVCMYASLKFQTVFLCSRIACML